MPPDSIANPPRPTGPRLVWQGLTPRTLLSALKLHLVTDLNGASPFPSVEGLEVALVASLPLPVAEVSPGHGPMHQTQTPAHKAPDTAEASDQAHLQSHFTISPPFAPE